MFLSPHVLVVPGGQLPVSRPYAFHVGNKTPPLREAVHGYPKTRLQTQAECLQINDWINEKVSLVRD